MKKRHLIPFTLLAAASVPIWYSMHPKPTQAATVAAELPAVQVAQATRETLSNTLTLTGELTPFQEVEVMAKVAGYVQQIRVDVGSVVRRGDLLAVLEVPEMKDDLTRAAAALERSRAEVARYKDEVRRAESASRMTHLTYQRLASVSDKQPGLVAQQEIDDAQSRDLMAAAQLAAARSTLSAAEEMLKVAEAEQSKVTTLMNYTRVVAPFDGVITRRYANTGSMIQAGTASQTQAMPLVRLSQNQLLRLQLPVPESAAGQVRAGSTVEVRIPSIARGFDGRVARTSDKLDSATRTMETEVDIPNPDHSLIPGMYAEVSLKLAEARQAVTVPLDALDRTAAQPQVTVVDPQGRIEPRVVSTGLETATRVELRSGVQTGELVVVGRQARLPARQQVRAIPLPAEAKGNS